MRAPIPYERAHSTSRRHRSLVVLTTFSALTCAAAVAVMTPSTATASADARPPAEVHTWVQPGAALSAARRPAAAQASSSSLLHSSFTPLLLMALTALAVVAVIIASRGRTSRAPLDAPATSHPCAGRRPTRPITTAPEESR